MRGSPRVAPGGAGRGQVMSCLAIPRRHPWTPLQGERTIDAIPKGRAAQEVAMSDLAFPAPSLD
jgi:hypothetical protein